MRAGVGWGWDVGEGVGCVCSLANYIVAYEKTWNLKAYSRSFVYFLFPKATFLIFIILSYSVYTSSASSQVSDRTLPDYWCLCFFVFFCVYFLFFFFFFLCVLQIAIELFALVHHSVFDYTSMCFTLMCHRWDRGPICGPSTYLYFGTASELRAKFRAIKTNLSPSSSQEQSSDDILNHAFVYTYVRSDVRSWIITQRRNKETTSPVFLFTVLDFYHTNVSIDPLRVGLVLFYLL